MSTQEKQSTVLIIDDDMGPRESLRILLAKAYRVECAESVDDGVRLLQEKKPELVVMDIRMPGKTGIEGLREIREIDPHVAVVMLTGFGALETAQEALRLGATDYVTKPFDTREMEQLVHRYTRQTLLERRRAVMLKDLGDVNSRLVEDLADKEKMATLGASSSELMHDLRNPLTIVSGYVELLSQQLEGTRDSMGQDYSQVAELMDVIDQNVQRCCELSRMWQSLGKGILLESRPVAAALILDDIKAGAEPLASTEGVLMRYSLDVEDVQVMGNRGQLLRAAHNVVSNAIHATAGRPQGEVHVRFRREAERLVLEVEDNGCGMTSTVLSRLFEPYFTTKAGGEGTGLGMVITRKIIEEHSGTMEVDSQPGRGTTVLIYLPVLQEIFDAPSPLEVPALAVQPA
jgi:signal transduction histidine kinase